MHTVLLGASRGCGYYTALNLLSDPANTCTLLLRKPEALATDAKLNKYVDEGRCKLVQGDAFKEDEVKKLFEGETVDFVVYTIGGTGGFGWTGVHLEIPDICTRSSVVLMNVLASLPDPKPRVVVTSSMGIGGTHDEMPLIHRIGYPLVIGEPHRDKEGLELVAKRASTTFTTPPYLKELGKKKPSLLSAEQYEAVPENIIPEMIIVRPAWLTDGEPASGETYMGENPVSGKKFKSTTVKRTLVGKFIAEECRPGKNDWVGKGPIVGSQMK